MKFGTRYGKKVVMLSLHHYTSQRRVDFHYIADSFRKMGWDVIFVTTPLSPFSFITGDHRWKYVTLSEINRAITLDTGITQYSYAPFSSPLSITGNRIIDLLSPVFIRIYRRRIPENLKAMIRDADLFIMESNSGLILFDLLKKINPNAKFVYRADDALETLHPHTIIIEYEKQISPCFDLITVPSLSLFNRFPGRNVILQHHGIKKELFTKKYPIPPGYGNFEKNFVFIGIAHLDTGFLRIAGDLFPRYGFHVIGPLSLQDMPANVISYGELPHLDTIPYLASADVGLHILKTQVGLDTYSDSLKVIQYTWCMLPIIAPEGIPSDRNHFIRYSYDDPRSIRHAVETAAAFDRNSIDTSGVQDWDEFTCTILNEVSLPVGINVT
jgi:2-beta-glucuronyltransferase